VRRITVNTPLVVSLAAVVVVTIVALWQLPQVLDALVTPGPDEDPTPARMERYLAGPGGDPPPVELPELLACVEEEEDDDEDGDGE